MVTPCVLERADGHTLDPDTRERIEQWTPVPGITRCSIRRSKSEREIHVAGQRVTVGSHTVSVPWDAPKARVGDRFATDLGVFYVAGVEHHSLPVQQRYSTAENQG